MTWRVYLVESTSGQAGRVLDPVSCTWSDELNSAGGGKIKLNKQDLAGLDPLRFKSWWGSVVLCYVRPDGTEVPWVGGPITSPPTETLRTIELDWSGIREHFESRVVERRLAITGSTYGEIAWRLALEGMNKPGGALPLVHGTGPETGTRQRTYEAWNLANNQVSKRWNELSEVINGPDIMFRPRWREEGISFEWEMVHGTNAQPTIHQDWTPNWDLTAKSTDVSDASITTDANVLASRVWGTGAGEGAGTVVTKAEDLTLVREGYPFRETVISDRDQKNPAPVLEKAQGHLRMSQSPIDQLSLKVRADSTKNPIGRWRSGDAAWVTLGSEWWNIPAGRHLMRIIKASGDLTETVNLEMQPDQWE